MPRNSTKPAKGNQRTILITGCSDGSLGAALAQAFHKEGWRVFASARNPAKLKDAEAADIETILIDVTSAASIQAGVSQVEKLTGGSLDALLNNAGAGYSMPLMDVEMDRVRQQFELNVFSLLDVTRAFVPLLMKSTHGGMLINNTSAASLTAGALPFQGAYNSSKAAATVMTEDLRQELAPFGIKVINMMTGAVKSTFFANAKTNTLPPNSMYNVAKEPIERFMNTDDQSDDRADPSKWAAQVAQDVSKESPPSLVWRGKHALTVRIASLLPIGSLDNLVKNMTGLDVLEKNLKEGGYPAKPKQL